MHKYYKWPTFDSNLNKTVLIKSLHIKHHNKHHIRSYLILLLYLLLYLILKNRS